MSIPPISTNPTIQSDIDLFKDRSGIQKITVMKDEHGNIDQNSIKVTVQAHFRDQDPGVEDEITLIVDLRKLGLTTDEIIQYDNAGTTHAPRFDDNTMTHAQSFFAQIFTIKQAMECTTKSDFMKMKSFDVSYRNGKSELHGYDMHGGVYFLNYLTDAAKASFSLTHANTHIVSPRRWGIDSQEFGYDITSGYGKFIIQQGQLMQQHLRRGLERSSHGGLELGKQTKGTFTESIVNLMRAGHIRVEVEDPAMVEGGRALSTVFLSHVPPVTSSSVGLTHALGAGAPSSVGLHSTPPVLTAPPTLNLDPHARRVLPHS